jgi:hypothetical protein
MFGNKYAADEIAKSFQTRVDSLKKAKVANEAAIKKAAQDSRGEDFLMDQTNSVEDSNPLDSAVKDHSAADADAKPNLCSKCNLAHDSKDGCVAKGSSFVSKELSKIAKSLSKKGESEAAAVVAKAAKDFSKNITKSVAKKSSKPNISSELGKIAKNLSKKGESEAASVVAKAAKDFSSDKMIKNAELNKFAKFQKEYGFLVDKKADHVLYELGKIASDLRREGKGFAADMVETTAMDIKNEAIAKAASTIEVIEGLKKMAQESYSEGDIMTGDVIQATILNIKNG